MPQSLSAVYIHLVFSTKHRQPLLRDQGLRNDLHSFPGRNLKNTRMPPNSGGWCRRPCSPPCALWSNHHTSRMGKGTEACIEPLVKREGRVCQFRMAGRLCRLFREPLEPGAGEEYIANQEEHHRKLSFQDEVRALLTKHEMDWDERYIWD